MSSSSIIFCGTSSFAVPALEKLAKDPAFRIDLVITQPDKPVGRSQELTGSPVKVAAQQLGLTVVQPNKINEWIRSPQSSVLSPHFLVVVSYGQILSQEVLDFPKVAPVNVHASLLPRWRGASPMQHAILAGDRQSGVTVQKMVKELDAGPIVAQEATTIDARETAPTLHDRLAKMGADLLVQTLKKPLKPVEQDASKVTLCGKLTREDGQVDPMTTSAEDIDRKVRALTPWPGVTGSIKGKKVKLLETALTETPRSIALPCAEGTLYVVRVQEPGKKPMSANDWERGLR
ncbi:methionyl-tRNA formyltransferase [Candidatus Peregrinibacteria bacterium]|nr:methionyl-tRNA formyltransferase [Candidatus Peregrinibacteria bacterium]